MGTHPVPKRGEEDSLFHKRQTNTCIIPGNGLRHLNIFYPLQLLSDWITYSVFGIQNPFLAATITFFIFDTIKIFLLLAILIFAISLLRTYIPPERVRDILSKQNEYVGNILAALIGVITPFCSCSAIPLFLGFVEAGIPLGVTFTFLVASPMINEVALILLFSMFGWKIALLYLVSGVILSIVAGVIIGRMHIEHLIEDFVYKKRSRKKEKISSMVFRERMEYAKRYTTNIIKKVWVYIIIGVGIGAWIHGYVPVDFLARYAGADKWYAVPLATLIGVPLYSNAAGIVPLVSALTEKGVSMGTTLAFMMAVTALSLPEFMILKRVMKRKLLVIFATIMTLGIILLGYLFNFILA
jgi:uncharacterized protein